MSHLGMSIERYKELQLNLDAKLTLEDHKNAGGFLHFCDEWDGLLIDKNCDEFECCSCLFSNEFDPETGKIVECLLS